MRVCRRAEPASGGLSKFLKDNLALQKLVEEMLAVDSKQYAMGVRTVAAPTAEDNGEDANGMSPATLVEDGMMLGVCRVCA